VLIEILTFFAVAAALSTLACLVPGVPAARWAAGVPGVAAVLAASGLITALLSGDPLAGRWLGIAGLGVWLLGWLRLRRWQPMAVLMLAMVAMAALAYLAYAVALTAAQSTGWVFPLASGLLLVLEVAALALSLSYTFEILDVLGRRGAPPPPPPVGPPPFVAIQVPTYNEPVDVVGRTLAALARLDYPRFMVQVVDNNTTDPATWMPLQAICAELGPRFQFMHLERWPGFKAGALNEATRRLPPEVEVIGVVDADYVVHPGWLSGTAPHFVDPRVAFVQAAQHYHDWEDDRYLRGLFYSYRYFFDVTMPARAHRNAIIFAGTMGLIRRSILDRVGGWDPGCVTEDAECSLRMLGLGEGLFGVYDPRPWGSGMMPLSFDGLKKQRFRWALGGIQILRMHWRDLLPLAPHRLRLTAAQRIHYLLGSVQWFGDLLTAVFTLILGLTAVAVATHHHLPLRQMTGTVLAVPLVFLVTGLLRALWALRRTTGCGWGDAVRALRVWFALAWVVSLACLRGLVRRGAAFLRTPKMEEGRGTLRRALRFSLAETVIALLAVATAAAMLAVSPGLSTALLGLLLLFEAFVFTCAPWASAAAERVAMTPARRAFLRSPQSTGDRPALAPALTALGAGGLAAVVIAATVAFAGVAPSTPAPANQAPGPPPLGEIAAGQPSSPSPTATPSPASTASSTPPAGPPPPPGRARRGLRLRNRLRARLGRGGRGGVRVSRGGVRGRRGGVRGRRG
jgi:cellulose synthase/poly-beta-1,6-N-acetylglucosamine synthase-like glycosyltransferase